MKILVTGASGYIGNRLVHELAERGCCVNALVRSSSAADLLQHPNIHVCVGDILDQESLAIAIKDCKQVYHTAAVVKAWVKNPYDYYTVNVDGTRNVLEAAKQAGIQKLVFTSTCGVIGPSLNHPMTENDPRVASFSLDYELSKKMSENLALQYAKMGMNIVIVSPSKIYGPGNVSHTLTTNAVIKKFLKKGFVFIPSPGTYQACFAFMDDIVNGHLLAMEKGTSGEKYILGGINTSYEGFFDRIRNLSSAKGHIVKLSKKTIKTWASLQWLNYKITGIQPTFNKKNVNVVFSNYTFSSEKAIKQLGYNITPIEVALKKTIDYLNTREHVQ